MDSIDVVISFKEVYWGSGITEKMACYRHKMGYKWETFWYRDYWV